MAAAAAAATSLPLASLGHLEAAAVNRAAAALSVWHVLLQLSTEQLLH
jgi:hypothetical protein